MLLRKVAKISSCVGLVALGALAVNWNTTPAAPAHGVSPQILIGPQAVPMAAGSPAYGLFQCNVGLFEPDEACYDPYQMRHAYGVDNLISAGYDGTGQTIVIIDAFRYAALTTQVDYFSNFYGLPPSSAFLTQYTPDGVPPQNSGWAGEITLDVEWAHAIAPGAKVALVLAKSSSDNDILSAIQYAVDNNLGDVISMSFGENEGCLDPATVTAWHNVFAQATQKGMTLFASSGDQGASQQTCDGNSWTLAPSHPASDPLVSGVGGTELHAAHYCLASLGCNPATSPAAGTYSDEIAWNELLCADAACDLVESESTGGGFSVVFDAPPFQKSQVKKTKGRAVPDVAYNAAIYHGVLTRFQGQWNLFGGTSAGSPQWAAITAIADQVAGHRLGYLNKAFYQIGQTPPNYAPSFHDITSGNNSVLEVDASNTDVEVDGYAAGLGWDATTGLGSPKVDGIVGRLIALTSPGDGVSAIATSQPHGNGKKGFAGTKQAH
ncbi:MAG TPA: S53 family peptidase [Rudaea sp.]|jgi:subtilase family serine protease|uniref:S53 family peptidase n=1 Tax=Rudaea sp. TaxID=2136325 RepID=UPI002F94C9A5